MLTGIRLKQKLAPTVKKMRAAGNMSRLAVLYMLLREPLSLQTLMHRAQMSPGLAAHHLKVLRAAGWVKKSKFGKLVEYSINEDAVKDALVFFRKP